MYPHEHYHHGHPEMHNHGEGRPYVEPDWFANHHDGALPLVSTIGRGPKGYGLSIDKDEQGNLIVSSDDPMQEPETFHVGDWNIYVTQENNGEIPVGQNTKFTVHVEDGVRHVAKDIVVPCGASGTQFFIGGTNDPLHRRDDNTYTIDNVWPWTQDLNREYGIPDPRVGDCILFSVDDDLAVGLIVQVVNEQNDKHVVAYTSNLYLDIETTPVEGSIVNVFSFTPIINEPVYDPSDQKYHLVVPKQTAFVCHVENLNDFVPLSCALDWTAIEDTSQSSAVLRLYKAELDIDNSTILLERSRYTWFGSELEGFYWLCERAWNAEHHKTEYDIYIGYSGGPMETSHESEFRIEWAIAELHPTITGSYMIATNPDQLTPIVVS